MIKEAVGFGNTIDEAKEDAINKLNAPAEADVNFDIISFPKKKLLGLFGGSKAEVKAYYEAIEKKPRQKKNNSPKSQAKKEKQANNTQEPKTPAKTPEVKPKKNDKIEYSAPVPASEIDPASPAGKAVAYIRTVIDAFNCKDINITVASRENASLITLEGEDVRIIIGRRGETLDALQYLASLVANNGGGYYRISINIGDYRERREETLTALASKIAEQVLKTGKSRTLEPMNPYERRIIHTAIQNIEGVVSKSFGEGSGRRIVVSLEGAQVKPPKSSSRKKNGNRSRGSRPSSQKVESAPREPKKDSDIPLYGKIN